MLRCGRPVVVFAIRAVAAIVVSASSHSFGRRRTLARAWCFLFRRYVLVDGVALLVALVRGDAVARAPRAGPWVSLASWASSPASLTFAMAGPDGPCPLLYLVAFWAIATGHLPGVRGSRAPSGA